MVEVGGGGGLLPIMHYAGMFHPNGVFCSGLIYFRLNLYKRVGISRVEV